MQLYGTTTSPFVRRVRIVAAEVGEPVDRIDTATDAGQAKLREVSSIRKVPVAVLDGLTLFDSRAIIDWLAQHRGWNEPERDRWRTSNLVNAIDTALDSIVQVFYLKRDGVLRDESPVEGTAFATRQLERTDAIFGWLASQLQPDKKSFSGGFGLAEMSVICSLDWMDFRKTYPTERAAGLATLRAAWAERPSIASTKPQT
jgi:glutathione S-transferase